MLIDFETLIPGNWEVDTKKTHKNNNNEAPIITCLPLARCQQGLWHTWIKAGHKALGEAVVIPQCIVG